jgi:hypothetical protein
VKNTPKTIKKKTQIQMGQMNLVNPNTGEVIPTTVINKNVDADFNFHKVWLQDILYILNTMGNKKIAVLSHLLKIMRNEDNSMNFTLRSLSKDTGISYPTIQNTISELIEANVIKRDKDIHSLYTFNPDLIVKGGSQKRQQLLIQYNFGDNDSEIENKAEQELKSGNFFSKEQEIKIHPNQAELPLK